MLIYKEGEFSDKERGGGGGGNSKGFGICCRSVPSFGFRIVIQHFYGRKAERNTLHGLPFQEGQKSRLATA